MKKILFAFSTILACSCGNYLDKSIFEPLSLEELNQAIKKDSSFATLYKHIQNINKNGLKSDVEKAQYIDLTYKRVHEIWEQKYGPLFNKYLNDWKNIYNSYLHKLIPYQITGKIIAEKIFRRQ